MTCHKTQPKKLTHFRIFSSRPFIIKLDYFAQQLILIRWSTYPIQCHWCRHHFYTSI